MALSSNCFCKFNASLEVKVYFIFLWFRPEAQPSCHTIKLDISCQSFTLVEFESFGKSIKENVVTGCVMRLLLVRIVQIHKVYSFESKVALTCCELVLQKCRMDAVNAASNVL